MNGGAKVWVLAFVVTAGVGFGALVAIGCATGANACPFSKSEPFTTTDGVAIWRNTCAGCHGATGGGGSGPSLVSGARAAYTLDELRAKISRGKPLAGMPAFSRSAFGRPALSEQQIDAVARYVIQFREAA